MSGDLGDDSLLGGDGDDSLSGGAGGDSLFGDSGSDSIFGGEGFDSLFGGIGDDVIVGGEGNDWLVGGAGADTFMFAGNSGELDVFPDFWYGEDRIAIARNINGTGIDTFEELMAAGAAYHSGSRFELGGGNVIVVPATPSELTAANFLFFDEFP
jgi:Ca2+-binding RTX toxin-like protein